MKKMLFMYLTLAIVSLMVMSCDFCKSNKQNEGGGTFLEPERQTVTEKIENLNPEYVIAVNRQDMYTNRGGEDYTWFETTIVYNDTLGSDNGGKVVSVTNIFQKVIDLGGRGFDTKCFTYVTQLNKSYNYESDAFMLGDRPLNDASVDVTFQEAYENMINANIPKPKSKTCVLRMPVGPNICNAQYIFGNRKEQIYVDAVTGKVSTKNPAYAKDSAFAAPLGEWP